MPSPGASAGSAIGANIANLNNLLNLTGQVNAFNQNQALNQVRTGLPLYDQMVAESSNNILDQIQGNVPGDVLDEILRVAAERGIMTGTTGSQNANAAMLRALGLTSLDLMQRGEQNLTGAIGRTPRGPLFDPSGMMVRPDDYQSAQMAANLYASAPDPMAAANRSLGAAQAGLRSGMASGPSWSQRNAANAPSWDKVRQTPQTAAWADYGPTQAHTGTNMEVLNQGQFTGQDWYNATFGGQGYRQRPNAAPGPQGGGFSNLNYDPNRYWADPSSGGFLDLDTGDFIPGFSGQDWYNNQYYRQPGFGFDDVQTGVFPGQE